MILDLGLPGISGIEVIGGLRGWLQAPIIVLSVRGQEADKVAGVRPVGYRSPSWDNSPFTIDLLLEACLLYTSRCV